MREPNLVVEYPKKLSPSEYAKDYRAKHPEYCQKHKEDMRRQIRQIRLEIINHYGAKCACCGEFHIEFLTIDHVMKNGKAERKKFGVLGVYQKIIKEGFPEDYQVICMNCNFVKRYSDKRFCAVHHPELY